MSVGTWSFGLWIRHMADNLALKKIIVAKSKEVKNG
jgi:hypothetical protein